MVLNYGIYATNYTKSVKGTRVQTPLEIILVEVEHALFRSMYIPEKSSNVFTMEKLVKLMYMTQWFSKDLSIAFIYMALGIATVVNQYGFTSVSAWINVVKNEYISKYGDLDRRYIYFSDAIREIPVELTNHPLNQRCITQMLKKSIRV